MAAGKPSRLLRLSLNRRRCLVRLGFRDVLVEFAQALFFLLFLFRQILLTLFVLIVRFCQLVTPSVDMVKRRTLRDCIAAGSGWSHGPKDPGPDTPLPHIARLPADRNPQSATLALRALIPPRLVLLSRRLFCELRVGRVAFRFARPMAMATRAMSSRSRLKASSRFFSRLRYCCALMTTTPYLLIR